MRNPGIHTIRWAMISLLCLWQACGASETGDHTDPVDTVSTTAPKPIPAPQGAFKPASVAGRWRGRLFGEGPAEAELRWVPGIVSGTLSLTQRGKPMRLEGPLCNNRVLSFGLSSEAGATIGQGQGLFMSDGAFAGQIQFDAAPSPTPFLLRTSGAEAPRDLNGGTSSRIQTDSAGTSGHLVIIHGYSDSLRALAALELIDFLRPYCMNRELVLNSSPEYYTVSEDIVSVRREVRSPDSTWHVAYNYLPGEDRMVNWEDLPPTEDLLKRLAPFFGQYQISITADNLQERLQFVFIKGNIRFIPTERLDDFNNPRRIDVPLQDLREELPARSPLRYWGEGPAA